MKGINVNINEIISDWDSLDVEKDTAFDEYAACIPRIQQHIKDKRQLTDCLEKILMFDLWAGYDKENTLDKRSLREVVGKLGEL